MSEQEWGGQVPDLWMLSGPELKRAIAELEAERETLEARCRVVRRRIAILRAEVVVRLSADGVRRLPYVVDPASAREALAAAGAPDGDGWVTVTLPLARGPCCSSCSPSPCW